MLHHSTAFAVVILILFPMTAFSPKKEPSPTIHLAKEPSSSFFDCEFGIQ